MPIFSSAGARVWVWQPFHRSSELQAKYQTMFVPRLAVVIRMSLAIPPIKGQDDELRPVF